MKKALLIGTAILSVTIFYLINKYYYPPKIVINESDLSKNIVIDTSEGKLEIELQEKPSLAVAHFVRLTRQGFYNRTKFHHIVPDLLIQAGDPLTKFDDAKLFWGQGGISSSFPFSKNNYSDMKAGTVAMADTGTKSYGSQFLIMTKDTSWMNGRAEVVGHITDGMDIVKKIERYPTDISGFPLDNIVIIRMTAE